MYQLIKIDIEILYLLLYLDERWIRSFMTCRTYKDYIYSLTTPHRSLLEWTKWK